MKISSTAINTLNQSCPKGLYAGVTGSMERDELVFAHGIVAHKILEVAHDNQGRISKQDALKIVEKACTETRTFRGTEKPPLPFDRAMEGLRIAMDYLASKELPLGVAEAQFDGKAGDHEITAIIDLVYSEELDYSDETYLAMVARDYKSAWNTDQSDLETTQRKIQQIVVAQNHDCDFVIPEVVNLRTGKTYRGDPVHIGSEEYRDMVAEVEVAAKVANAAMDNPVAVPSTRCASCPFAYQCDSTLLFPGSIIEQYLLAKNAIKELEPRIKEMAQENSIEADGLVIGYEAATRKKPSDDVAEIIAWDFHELGDHVVSYIKNALSLIGLGAGNIRAYAKHKDKTEKADFLETALIEESYVKFSVRQK